VIFLCPKSIYKVIKIRPKSDQKVIPKQVFGLFSPIFSNGGKSNLEVLISSLSGKVVEAIKKRVFNQKHVLHVEKLHSKS